MSTRVFDWSANPAVDRFSFKQSVKRAAAIVAEGRGDFITLPCGRRAVHLRPPQEFLTDQRNHANSGSFDSSWQIKPSGGMPVWQMVT
jgi:hypothetical protein